MYRLSCGWKQGLGWGEKLCEKGSVKQTFLIAKYNQLTIVRRLYAVAPKSCQAKLLNFAVYPRLTVLDDLITAKSC